MEFVIDISNVKDKKYETFSFTNWYIYIVFQLIKANGGICNKTLIDA